MLFVFGLTATTDGQPARTRRPRDRRHHLPQPDACLSRPSRVLERAASSLTGPERVSAVRSGRRCGQLRSLPPSSGCGEAPPATRTWNPCRIRPGPGLALLVTAWLSGFRDPGPALEGESEGFEGAQSVAGGGGEVGPDRAEFFRAGHGAQAAGDLDAELAHPDGLLSRVIAERDAQVAGEPEVVGLAVLHPRGEGVPLLLELALAGGVEGGPGGGGLAVPVLVLVPGFRVGRVLACGPGGICGLVQGQERVDGLLRPRLVQVGAGLGDRDQLPEDVGTA